MRKRVNHELPVIEHPCCPLGTGRDSREAGEAIAGGLAEGARRFRALGDETRLAILRQLRAEGEVCACAFVSCCTLAQPTVSHHLRVLREAGLVTAEKRGLWVYYRLDPRAIAAVHRLIP